MLRLHFFASIRERLGCQGLSIDYGAGCHDIHALVALLERERLPGCAKLLLADNTIVAVNREVVSRDECLHDGDEVAFYPPVTGG